MRSHGLGLDVGAVGAHDSLLFQKTRWWDLSESAAKFLFELRISPTSFGAAISKRSRCSKVQGDVRSPVQPHTMRQVVISGDIAFCKAVQDTRCTQVLDNTSEQCGEHVHTLDKHISCAGTAECTTTTDKERIFTSNWCIAV